MAVEVIPVIDIKGGAVMHARGGNRALYRPIETPLAKSADPIDVIHGLLDLFGFDTLYVADLDGIEDGVPDDETQARILDCWPGRRVFIDDGRVQDGSIRPNVRRQQVVGSESIEDLSVLASAEILSLDFKGDTFLGPQILLERTEWWPSEVIVMTLSAVGNGAGPEFPRINEIIGKGDGRAIYASGGVRHVEDLRALKFFGARGVLVATALHAGKIKTRDLEEIAGKSF